MKVLIVDDSAFMRKVIKEMILSDGSIEVVGTARDGIEGVAKAIELKPDLITMDIEMPRMNGIDALRQIMIKCSAHKPAVLMCSSLTVDGSVEALKALKIGASDFIAKDPATVGKHDPEFQNQLLSKIHAIGGHRRRLSAQTLSASTGTPEESSASNPGICTSFDQWTSPEHIDAIVIGSSTGGPPVLEKIFSNLPSTLPVPILVAQHIPGMFTRSLAQRLDKLCACGADLAEHGTSLSEPKIYISMGGMHMKPTMVAGKKLIARLLDTYEGATYKPSIDLLYTTAAEIFGSRLLAIQLTGMGEDGAIGAQKIKAAGGHVIAQNEKSCVVYGMPRAVVENGTADAIFDPEDIHKVLKSICTPTGSVSQTAYPAERKIA